MISRAHRNVLILLDLTDSHIGYIRRVYLNRPRNKTVLELTSKASQAVMEARKLWPGKMSVKEAQLKVNETRNFLYEYMHPGKELTAVILTSLALDMLEWLLKRVSGRKAESVRAALSAVNRLHRYFDRNLTKLNDYREAKKIAEGFYREVAA